MICEECGARYEEPGDSCTSRFEQLLALDHSRQEPWGSRHGQAFAAFALQHPLTHARSLDAAFDSLLRIYSDGEDPRSVFDDRRRNPDATRFSRPPRPRESFRVTIADLNDFAAETYAAKLDDWCRAALNGWTA